MNNNVSQLHQHLCDVFDLRIQIYKTFRSCFLEVVGVQYYTSDLSGEREMSWNAEGPECHPSVS